MSLRLKKWPARQRTQATRPSSAIGLTSHAVSSLAVTKRRNPSRDSRSGNRATVGAAQSPFGLVVIAFFRCATAYFSVLPGDGEGTSFKGQFPAQRFGPNASPLTTTVYTHPSDQDMAGRVRGLTC